MARHDRKNGWHTDEETNKQKFEGRTMHGDIVDTSGDNPVVDPYIDAPNIIVEDEAAGDWTEGETMHVRVTKAKDTYMFGNRVESEPEEQEKAEDHRVEFYVAGHAFESEKFRDEKRAASLADYIENHVTEYVDTVRKR